MKEKKFIIAITTICFGVVSMLTFYACKKPLIEAPRNSALQTMSGAINDFVFGQGGIITTDYTYTKLGRKYNQPLTVNNVLNAWNALSSKAISSLAPTHKYIKLMPQTPEDLKAIADANIPIYTFPLDYEIIQYGDYMRDPMLEPNGMPPVYTLIPAGKQIPIPSFELLDEIYLLDLRSIVAKKAFELVGESAVYPGDPEGEEIIPAPLLTFDNTLQEHISELEGNWGTLYPVPEDPIMPPPPPSTGPADNVGTPGTVTSACNCSLNSDYREPSGCIKVEETQFFNGNVVFEGVNDVMADFIGPNFQRLSPHTNANGCYKDSRKIRFKPLGIRLPVAFSVIFVSGKKTIKAVKAGSMFEFAFPDTHVIGNVSSSGLNNCNVTYLRDWDISHHETKHYSAATFNNALYDFDGYASADGLNTTHNNLQILIHRFAPNVEDEGSGAAPMFNKMQMSGSAQAITIGTFLTATVGGIAGIAPNPVGTFVADVYFCYNRGGTAQEYTTDQIKELGYHEYAHVIHYKKVGNPMWEANIQFVVNHGGYGSNGDNGSGRCALIESWAYYLGREYAHRRYGPNRHSNGFQNFFNSWYGLSETRIFDQDYFPAGFLHDLRDDNAYNTAHGLTTTTFVNGSFVTMSVDQAQNITDNCSGYTNSMIYNKMVHTTNTMTGLINQLDDNLPTGTTQANYDLLRQSYGY